MEVERSPRPLKPSKLREEAITRSGSKSNDSSNAPSRPSSVGAEDRRTRTHNKVKFSVGTDHDVDPPPPRKALPSIHRPPEPGTRGWDVSLLDTDVSMDVTEDSPFKTSQWSWDIDHITTADKETSAISAQERANRLAVRLGSAPVSRAGSPSAPTARRNSTEDLHLSPHTTLSLTDTPTIAGNTHGANVNLVNVNDIPLIELDKDGKRTRPGRQYPLHDGPTDEDCDDSERANGVADVPQNKAPGLVRSITTKLGLHRLRTRDEEDQVSTRPVQYKDGILTSLLMLHGHQNDSGLQNSSAAAGNHKKWDSNNHPPVETGESSQSPVNTLSSQPPPTSTSASGSSTPNRHKWSKSPSHSFSSLAHLLSASNSPGESSRQGDQPDLPRSRSSGMINTAVQSIRKLGHHRNSSQVHFEARTNIAAVEERERYLATICRALMQFGAPSHRLEDYMVHSAQILEIHGQFIYLPGCMLCSFDDPFTHTAAVKLIKETQGLDLTKFADVFQIYKDIAHKQEIDQQAVADALTALDKITNKKPRYTLWLRILVYGFASVCVGPFAFDARPIDWPISFGLGILLGFFQLFLTPKSSEFSHVFEVVVAILTSFIARAFGSISINGEKIFCFSAIAQSSIALILPGYTILCGSLELQSKSIVSGSVRMVYAIIYALFLGFGITIGTALYGFMDTNAVDVVTCANPEDFQWWNFNFELSKWPFVAFFALCLIVINQGRMSEAPAMVFIAFAGYLVNFFSAKYLANNVQVANALGAFAIGVLANFYSRALGGMAAAALYPAIFVQVPSGLAASGSLVAGLTSAQQITGNATGISVINNGTQGFLDASNSTWGQKVVYSGTIFNVGYGMTQVAIGISVGLTLSSLVAYPFGKKNSVFFSF